MDLLAATRTVSLVTGVGMYWTGFASHRETGEEFYLFTAPSWLWIICGKRLPSNRLAWLPTLYQLAGLVILLIQCLAVVGIIGAVTHAILFMAIVSIWVAARWVRLFAFKHPTDPVKWYSDVLEKHRDIESCVDMQVAWVEYYPSGGRPIGVSVAAFAAFEIGHLIGQPRTDAAQLVGLLITGLFGLALVIGRAESWEYDDDSIRYVGSYGARAIIRWADVTRVDLIHEDVFIRDATHNIKVQSAGRGFPALLAFIKRRVPAQNFSESVRCLMTAVDEAPLR